MFIHSDSKTRQNLAKIEAGNPKAQVFFSTGEKIELDQVTSDTIYKDNTILELQQKVGQKSYDLCYLF